MQDLDTSTYVLQQEMEWLQRLLQYRNNQRSVDLRTVPTLTPPVLPRGVTAGYGALVEELNLDFENRLLLILALAPTIAPQFLDKEIGYWARTIGNSPASDMLPVWGVVYGQMYRGILPSALLYVFLLVGDQFAPRLALQRKIMYQQLRVMSESIVLLSDVPVCEPRLNGILSIEQNYGLSLLL
jgi:hypothetical protein